MSDYEYDVFVSYRRSGYGNARTWVHNHFAPLLRHCLADEMGTDPAIFLDVETETGSHWPSVLERALARSRMLVAVWSPQYFRSSWCVAELMTMSAREQLLGLAGPSAPGGLIYPVIFSDSRHFPPEALTRQAVDLRDLNIPYQHYQKTEEYLELHRAVRSIAAELAELIKRVPPWRSDWPVMRPKVLVPAQADVPAV